MKRFISGALITIGALTFIGTSAVSAKNKSCDAMLRSMERNSAEVQRLYKEISRLEYSLDSYTAAQQTGPLRARLADLAQEVLNTEARFENYSSPSEFNPSYCEWKEMIVDTAGMATGTAWEDSEYGRRNKATSEARVSAGMVNVYVWKPSSPDHIR